MFLIISGNSAETSFPKVMAAIVFLIASFLQSTDRQLPEKCLIFSSSLLDPFPGGRGLGSYLPFVREL